MLELLEWRAHGVTLVALLALSLAAYAAAMLWAHSGARCNACGRDMDPHVSGECESCDQDRRYGAVSS